VAITVEKKYEKKRGISVSKCKKVGGYAELGRWGKRGRGFFNTNEYGNRVEREGKPRPFSISEEGGQYDETSGC